MAKATPLSIKEIYKDQVLDWLNTDEHWYAGVREIKAQMERHGWLILPPFNDDKEIKEFFSTFDTYSFDHIITAMFGKLAVRKLPKVRSKELYMDIAVQIYELIATYDVQAKRFTKKRNHPTIKSNKQENPDMTTKKKTSSKSTTKKATVKKATTKKATVKKASPGKEFKLQKVKSATPAKMREGSRRAVIFGLIKDGMSSASFYAACEKAGFDRSAANFELRVFTDHHKTITKA